MKERLQKKFKELQKKDKKGFTLIELIVVLVILGIVLALTVPAVTGYIDDAKNAKYLAEARSVFVVAEVERARTQVTSGEADWNPTAADITKYSDKAGVTITALKYVTTDTKYTFTFESGDKVVSVEAVSNDKIEVKTITDK